MLRSQTTIDEPPFPEFLSPASSLLSLYPIDPCEFELQLNSAKQHLQERVADGSLSEKYKKLLTAFLDCLGHTKGAWNLIVAILNPKHELESIATYLHRNVLIAVRAIGGKTPAVPTPLFEDEARVELLASILDTTSRNDQTFLKRAALQRDGGKCLITGFPDGTVYPNDDDGMSTEAAHIFPHALGKFDDSKPSEVRSQAEIFAALPFVFPELEDFQSSHINHLTNILTLIPDLHKDFGELRIALQPMSRENQYRFLKFQPNNRYFLKNINAVLRLECHDPQYASEMPDHKLLNAHAVIAQIWDMTGMESEFQKLTSMLSLPQLAHDGSTEIPQICIIS